MELNCRKKILTIIDATEPEQVSPNYSYYNCTALSNKFDLMTSCKNSLDQQNGTTMECGILGCNSSYSSDSCSVTFYNISSLPLSNIITARRILNSVCDYDLCVEKKTEVDQYLQGCTEFNTKALRPTYLALDFVNRGEDRDEHVANCFFGDLDKRKELKCEKIIYEYIECNGVTKQVLNATDYDCALNHN